MAGSPGTGESLELDVPGRAWLCRVKMGTADGVVRRGAHTPRRLARRGDVARGDDPGEENAAPY